MKKVCASILFFALLLCIIMPVRAAGTLHTAYLAGYPDGTIRPEAAVTRAQLAVVLLRLAEAVCAKVKDAFKD